MKNLRLVKHLEAFLNALTRIDPRSKDYERTIVQASRGYITHDGDKGDVDARCIWVANVHGFNIVSFRRILQQSFEAVKHRYSDELADAFLLLFTYWNDRKDPIGLMERILSSVQPVTLTQYYLPLGTIQEDFKGFRFGDFSLGQLDERRFERQCKKATSNYYELYRKKLAGRICVMRAPYEVTIIVWQSLVERVMMMPDGFDDALLIYFEKLSALLFNDFWVGFVEQQSVQIALGVPYIDAELFKRLYNSEMVSIFSDIEAYDRIIGYVVPVVNASYTLTSPYLLDDTIKALAQRLKSDYSFSEFGTSEIHKTIQSFTNFTAKAHIHFHEGRVNEAFLHFVIALDLLLGDKAEATQSVSKRAAIIIHETFDVGFAEQKKRVEKIYNERSRYVHQGQDVDVQMLKSLNEICSVMLEALFDLQSRSGYDEPGAYAKWLKKLDYAVASQEAEKQLSAEELAEIGIRKRELLAID